jgi:hypothetical protein
MFRRGDHLLHQAALHNSTVVKNSQAVAEIRDRKQIMRDEQHAHLSLPPQPGQQV